MRLSFLKMNLLLKYTYRLPILILILLINNSLEAQTKIHGKVLDAETRAPVPFGSVAFLDTEIGCVTDANGEFFLETYNKQTSLVAACMGYESDTLTVKFGVYQEIEILLKSNSYDIQEVTVLAGENPSIAFMKKVQKNRKKNNPEKGRSYSYEQYNKMQVDINNFDPNIQKRKFMNGFEEMFKGLDTASSSGKVYMPMVISESLSDYYYQKSPLHRKEVIKASKISGVENSSVSRYMGQMYLDFNFYKNYISVTDKQFVSPISSLGLNTYEYYLIDSAYIDNSYCYHLTFKPKRKFEYTFKGDMWITDTTFALKEISARMSKTANIDFVSDFYVNKKYTKKGPIFFPVEEEFFIDFNLYDITTGFFGHRYISRKNVKINPKFPPNFFSSVEVRELEVKKDATEHDSTQWESFRHKSLSEKESHIYKAVDVVKEQPAYRFLENVVYLWSTGYWRIKYIELGPYYKIYSHNALEASRWRLGYRTSTRLSKTFRLSGYGAYGTGDKKFKYGIGGKWRIKRDRWTLAGIAYYDDLIQLGAVEDRLGTDNIFSLSPYNDKLLLIKNLDLTFFRDITTNIKSNIALRHRRIYPTKFIQFVDKNTPDKTFEKITSTELICQLHIGINEEFVEGAFNRFSLGSVVPLIDLSYSYGIPGIAGSSYEYHKFSLSFSQSFSMGMLGRTEYNIQAGKIFGRIPFPLLAFHKGNNGYFFEKRVFNLMNFLEFTGDQYINVFAEHHFNGLFFNHIPLLRRLKLREVIYAKAAWSSLTDRNKNVLQFPEGTSTLTTPYLELGLGIENILNLISINYSRRITHTEKPDIRKNGILIGIRLSF